MQFDAGVGGAWCLACLTTGMGFWGLGGKLESGPDGLTP